MAEDKQSLEISCDCAEDSGSPSGANKIVFSFNPQHSPSATVNPAETAENKSEQSLGEDVPVAFVIRVWTHGEYLIVQVNEISFAVYDRNGSHIGTEDSWGKACGLCPTKKNAPRQ